MPLPLPSEPLFDIPPRIDPEKIAAVRLEAGSKCQLRCPACPTGRRETKDTPVGWGWLAAADFEGFLDRHPSVRTVELSNYGEILLNPQLARIAAAAAERGVVLEAKNGVNMNTATEESLAVLARFAVVAMSIDGCSQETYVQYRRGGNFDNAWRNATRLVQLRREAGLPLSGILWQYVIFPHNEHEIGRAFELASELGITLYPKMSWDGSHRKLSDPGSVARFLGASDADIQDPGAFLERRFCGNNQSALICQQLWTTPQINWDGTLLGCCVNYTRSLGNVFETGLAKAMESAPYRQLMDVVTGRALATPETPCRTCHIYRRTLAPNYKWRLLPERILRRLGLGKNGG